MKNIFDTLTGKLPKPAQKDIFRLNQLEAHQTPAVSPSAFPASTSDLISQWQKENTPEQTAEILRRMQPTISSAMTSYAPGMDQQLSVKAANLTLSALKSFDPSRGVEPSTYVFHNLKRLSRLGSQTANIIPVSESMQADRRYLQNLAERFLDDNGREASDAELADMAGMSLKRVRKLLDSGATVINESATLTEDSGKDTVSMSAVTADDYFEYVYASVGPVDQKIMEWSSGRHGKPMLSNNEIAKRLGISAAAVSQRRARISNMLGEVRELI